MEQAIGLPWGLSAGHYLGGLAKEEDQGLVGLALVLERQLFVLFLFLLVGHVVGIPFGPIMFGQKAKNIVPMGFDMELVVLNQGVQLHQVVELEVDALKKDEQSGSYGDYPVHVEAAIIRNWRQNTLPRDTETIIWMGSTEDWGYRIPKARP